MLLQDKLNVILKKINNIENIDSDKFRDINECVDDLYNIVNNLENDDYIIRKKIFNKFFPYMYLYKLHLDNTFTS